MALCKYGPDGKCGRNAVARGMCSSHRRRWMAGKPLDSPVRKYQRYKEGPDGGLCTSHHPAPEAEARGLR